MLKDPRWDKELTLANFALFVASKDPDERYAWSDCRNCAVGQWLSSIGRDIPLAQWNGDVAVANRLAHGAPRSDFTNPGRWTFRDLSDRILDYQRAAERA